MESNNSSCSLMISLSVGWGEFSRRTLHFIMAYGLRLNEVICLSIVSVRTWKQFENNLQHNRI